jgi:putative hydrolase of the HAD superfamily
MTTPVSATLFDLDGVVRHWPGEGRAEAERTFGLPTGALRRIAYKEAFVLANVGVYTHQEWLESVRRDLVAEFGPAAAKAVEVWAKDAGNLDPEVAAVLAAIRTQGLQVGILTNNTSAVREDLARIGFDAFDVLINSADIGVVKPCPMAYRLAADVMGVPPEQLFFTDDKHVNVVAARHVGMHAVQFTAVPRLIEDLASCGIHIPAPTSNATAVNPT